MEGVLVERNIECHHQTETKKSRYHKKCGTLTFEAVPQLSELHSLGLQGLGQAARSWLGACLVKGGAECTAEESLSKEEGRELSQDDAGAGGWCSIGHHSGSDEGHRKAREGSHSAKWV